MRIFCLFAAILLPYFPHFVMYKEGRKKSRWQSPEPFLHHAFNIVEFDTEPLENLHRGGGKVRVKRGGGKGLDFRK